MNTFILIVIWVSVVWIGFLWVYMHSMLTYMTIEWAMCKIGFKGFGKYSLLDKDKSWPFKGRRINYYMANK